MSTWGELQRNGEATGKVKVMGSWEARTPQTVGLLLRAIPPEIHLSIKALRLENLRCPQGNSFLKKMPVLLNKELQ